MTTSSTRGQVFAAATVLFAILVAHGVLETARDALFLARLGPEHLAAAYLVMAIAALGAVGALRRWGRLRDPRRLLIVFLVVAVVGTTVLAATITLAPALVFVLYVWTGFVATLVVPSFWTALDRSLHITEAKRVFGAIGAGGVLGAMTGSAFAGVLGELVAPHLLVTAGAAAFVLALVAAIVLVPRGTAAEVPARVTRVAELSRRSQQYVRWLLVLGLISTIALTAGDLAFKHVMAQRLPADKLAGAFGAIYTGLNVVGLVIQLAVTPRLLARWGVGSALTLLPAIVVASALGFVGTGTMIAMLALKLGDGGLRHSLHRVGMEILYLPVPAAIRDGWKLVVDALGQRGGQALAALLVFAVGAFGSGARGLALIAACAGAVWLAIVVLVRRAYIAQFRETLEAGEIQRDVQLPVLDAAAVERLTESLASPDELEALTALDLLARHTGVSALVLYHPRPAVVRHALSLLEGEVRPDVARVLAHLLEHSDPKIRAAALAASVRTGGSHTHIEAALSDPEPAVRAVALVTLACGGDAYDGALTELADGSAEDRLALAEAIAFQPHPRFRGLLCELVARGETDVTRQVLHVWAREPQLVEIERLLGLLADARVRGDARRVFLALGARGLGVLVAALDDPATPLPVRRHLPRTISPFRSPPATAALVARLPHEADAITELKLLRALGRLRSDDPHAAIDPAPVREYLRRAVHEGVRYAAAGRFLAADRAHATASGELLQEVLFDRRRHAIEHAFRALGIMYPRAGLRSAYDAFASGDEARISAAREILAAVAPADVRGDLLAILDGEALHGEVVFASEHDLLASLLADRSESLRCVVAHHVAERHLSDLREDLARLRPLAGPPLVVQAFDRALEVLHGGA